MSLQNFWGRWEKNCLYYFSVRDERCVCIIFKGERGEKRYVCMIFEEERQNELTEFWGRGEKGTVCIIFQEEMKEVREDKFAWYLRKKDKKRPASIIFKTKEDTNKICNGGERKEVLILKISKYYRDRTTEWSNTALDTHLTRSFWPAKEPSGTPRRPADMAIAPNTKDTLERKGSSCLLTCVNINSFYSSTYF